MDLQARIGRRLAELREARGVSSHQLAKEVGVTSQFVGRIESGERAPSLRVLQGLAAALEIDPAELLRPDGPPRGRATMDSVPLTQLRGAAQRLSSRDLDFVLALARRLGQGK